MCFTSCYCWKSCWSLLLNPMFSLFWWFTLCTVAHSHSRIVHVGNTISTTQRSAREHVGTSCAHKPKAQNRTLVTCLICCLVFHFILSSRQVLPFAFQIFTFALFMRIRFVIQRTSASQDHIYNQIYALLALLASPHRYKYIYIYMIIYVHIYVFSMLFVSITMSNHSLSISRPNLNMV